MRPQKQYAFATNPDRDARKMIRAAILLSTGRTAEFYNDRRAFGRRLAFKIGHTDPAKAKRCADELRTIKHRLELTNWAVATHRGDSPRRPIITLLYCYCKD